MFLSDIDIKKAVEKGDITLEGFDKSRLQPASYDVLLSNKFVVTDAHASGYADPYNKIYPRTREIIIKDLEPFILHPGVSVLGYIHDYVGAKRDYLIHLSGKSSLARAGLIVHNTAGIINPGHYLNMTLELYNTSNVPIILRPKMEIAQFLFSKMMSSSTQDWKQTEKYIDVEKYTPTQDSMKRSGNGITLEPVVTNTNMPLSGQATIPEKIAEVVVHQNGTITDQNIELNNDESLSTPSTDGHSPLSTHSHPEEQYLDLLRQTLDGEEQIDKGTGVKTYSVFGRQIRFDLSKGFPLLTTKKVYWKGVLHELYWFMSGQSNIKYLVYNDVHIWDDYPYKVYKKALDMREVREELNKEQFIDRIKTNEVFANKWGELPHIYGEMWRRWQGKDGREIDQLGWVIDELRKDPDAHNTIVNSWNPEYLYSMAEPSKGAIFPICHNMFQVNIKDSKVCLQLYQRSADVFLGVPFNIASYALLTIIIAKILGREPGEFVHTFGDLHIYENHIDQAQEQLKRVPKQFPTVHINGVVESLDSFNTNQVILENYDSYKSIKADFVVSGGFNEKIHNKTQESIYRTIDSPIGPIVAKQTTTDHTIDEDDIL